MEKSGRADSNRRPPAPKAGALTRLRYVPPTLSVLAALPGLARIEEITELLDLLAAQVLALAAFDTGDQVAHERRKLDGVERLRHVVDPAEIEASSAVSGLGAGG
jgi:hypothetical protein